MKEDSNKHRYSMIADSKTDFWLSDRYKLAQLIVKNIHECYRYIVLQHSVTESRQRFSIERGRNFVKGVVGKCLVCRGFEGKLYRYPVTPQLTPLRLNDSRPFVTTEIENFGPVYVKNVYGQSN